MNRPVVVMPDGVAVVIGYLVACLAGVRPVPVFSRVPEKRPNEFVTVRRIGGARQTPVSDRPRIDVHTWAESDEDAHDLAALCRAFLGAMPGVHNGVTVYRVTEVGGPIWTPDNASSQSRYAFAVEIHMRGQTLPLGGT